jgi:hypothetical protein
VSLPELLASKRLERRLSNLSEIQNLRKLIDRDLVDSALPGCMPAALPRCYTETAGLNSTKAMGRVQAAPPGVASSPCSE